MKKICAVIVTYNRPELLCRCVKKLMEQDYPIDVLIYDNHSSKDTRGELEKEQLLQERVTYHYAESNTGGSGGFHNGMKMAMEKGYDALLLLDDDGYAVNTNTVSLLVKEWEKLGTDNCILNSLVVSDPDTLNLSFPLNREFDGNKVKEWAKDGLLKDLISPFNGTFVTAEVVNKIGYPIKEFFVYGDETEYYLRASHAGVQVYTVVESIYYHPTLVVQKRRFLWRKISVSAVPLWKAYCSARNTMYFTKKYFGTKELLKSKCRIYLGCLYAPKNKWAQFKEARKGIKDGLKGDFSRKLDLSK